MRMNAREGTEEEVPEAQPGPERRPLGYYDDDGTGYEVFRPEDEEEGEEEEDRGGG